MFIFAIRSIPVTRTVLSLSAIAILIASLTCGSFKETNAFRASDRTDASLSFFKRAINSGEPWLTPNLLTAFTALNLTVASLLFSNWIKDSLVLFRNIAASLLISLLLLLSYLSYTYGFC